jgi:flavin reductase (DIM6/NTAB) family NADH-FMN oxidoreductase RutF
MEYSVAGLAEPEAYHVFSQLIIPRPVAWVMSDNGASPAVDRWNLAPFSYFNGICSSPSLVMFSIGVGPGGRDKDSLRNLRERPTCVIALASVSQAAAVQATSAELPHGVGEPGSCGVELADWDWPVPRVAASPLSLGCLARQFTPVGGTGQVVVFAEIVKLWVRPGVGALDADGQLQIDVAAFDPLARVGRGGYSRLAPVFRPPAAPPATSRASGIET